MSRYKIKSVIAAIALAAGAVLALPAEARFGGGGFHGGGFGFHREFGHGFGFAHRFGFWHRRFYGAYPYYYGGYGCDPYYSDLDWCF